MPKFRIMLAAFPGGGTTSSHTGPWVTETAITMREDPRIGPGNVLLWQMASTPVTMSRNKCLKVAREAEIDVVVMYDNDMKFDLPYPDAVPFWPQAFDFLLEQPVPSVIAAPYCGPPPLEMPYVFRFEDTEGESANPNFQLKAFTRPEAARMTGITRVAALPTGLMAIDMRALKDIPPPYFYYEFTDETQSEMASTEDVAFSRDLTYAGVPLFCAWQSWAGHIKPKMVGKPLEIPPQNVPGWVVDRAHELAPDLDRSDFQAWREKPRGVVIRSPKPSPKPEAFANANGHG